MSFIKFRKSSYISNGEHFYYEQVLDLVRTFLLQLLKGLYDFSSIAFGVVDWIN
jgi:hypothetical protein